MTAAKEPHPQGKYSSNSISRDPHSEAPTRSRMGRKSSLGGLAVIALVAIYAFARPAINEQTGWNLPELKVNSTGQVVSTDEREANPKPEPTPKSTNSASKIEQRKSEDATGQTSSGQKPTSAKSKTANSSDGKTNSADPTLHFGLLRDTGNDRFLSPAGLLYTPGSAEGHRIEHVRRHTEDDPGRPGSHGVFDGGIEGALKTIDDAYTRAKQGARTTKREEDGRVIYTVDIGKRIGFVGGRDGARKRNPMARRVTLVLEDNRVITAYPK